ncbi:hypothetical protein CA606_18095 [Caulobacter vibrioides]|uniref:Uncharacterized protein n=2 Tax=Caulobacter vibrioides TaxID=155892 RepID=A0A290MPR7_CAUVI|nr:hypothetical protein CA606_18095 [Caulobacter vibrioides]
MWAAGAAFALAAFCAMAASGGAAGAEVFATIFIVMAGGLAFLGFWKGLFSKIEARLMDIQAAQLGISAPAEAASPTRPSDEARPADNYLG